MSIQSTQVKVSGNSTGETLTMKKDGYASGSVPKFARAGKQGKDSHHGYSGPNVAMAQKP